MENKRVVNLRLPADPSYVPALKLCVCEAAKKAGLSESDIDNVVLAATEAAANVIEHAFLPQEEGCFEIACESSSLAFKVIVRDKGYPFSPERAEEYSIDKVMKGGKVSGLGLYLMKHSVDNVSFHNNGTGGKEVHLVKYIDQSHIENRVDKAETGPSKKPERIDYRVELLDPERSIEVSQCAYRTYGYNYIHEFIYYPERVAEMNRKKQLISAVAINNKTNEIISHAALEAMEGKDVVELGAAFTKPDFRRQGCFSRISEYLLDVAAKEKIKGLYARAVTIHTFSQKTILKNNFKDCGIMIGMGQASMFKDTLEHGTQRESMAISFRNVDQLLDKALYAPHHHRAILEDIYSKIGIPAKWQEPPAVKPELKYSEVETKVLGPMRTAIVKVDKYGKDMLKKMEHGLAEMHRSNLEAAFLYLDLCDPLTPNMVKKFEKMGFFFSGVLPSGSRQNLVLQYLNKIRIDYSKICAASDSSAKLLSYIKALDPNQ